MTGYAVYYCEHLRDGIEEGGRLFDNLPAAEEFISKLASGFGGDNLTFKLFELGKELPISFEDVQEPQPPKTVRRVAKTVTLRAGY